MYTSKVEDERVSRPNLLSFTKVTMDLIYGSIMLWGFYL